MTSNEVTIKVIDALDACGIAYLIENVSEPSTESQ
jgi:hypothetical protein